MTTGLERLGQRNQRLDVAARAVRSKKNSHDGVTCIVARNVPI